MNEKTASLKYHKKEIFLLFITLIVLNSLPGFYFTMEKRLEQETEKIFSDNIPAHLILSHSENETGYIALLAGDAEMEQPTLPVMEPGRVTAILEKDKRIKDTTPIIVRNLYLRGAGPVDAMITERAYLQNLTGIPVGAKENAIYITNELEAFLHGLPEKEKHLLLLKEPDNLLDVASVMTGGIIPGRGHRVLMAAETLPNTFLFHDRPREVESPQEEIIYSGEIIETPAVPLEKSEKSHSYYFELLGNPWLIYKEIPREKPVPQYLLLTLVTDPAEGTGKPTAGYAARTARALNILFVENGLNVKIHSSLDLQKRFKGGVPLLPFLIPGVILFGITILLIIRLVHKGAFEKNTIFIPVIILFSAMVILSAFTGLFTGNILGGFISTGNFIFNEKEIFKAFASGASGRTVLPGKAFSYPISTIIISLLAGTLFYPGKRKRKKESSYGK